MCFVHSGTGGPAQRMAVNETAAAAFSSVTVGKPLGAVDVVGSGSPDVVAAPVDLPSWLMSVTLPRGIFA